MEDCTEQKLEMEQPDELYPLGRALRKAYNPVAGTDVGNDPAFLLSDLDKPADPTV